MISLLLYYFLVSKRSHLIFFLALDTLGGGGELALEDVFFVILNALERMAGEVVAGAVGAVVHDVGAPGVTLLDGAGVLSELNPFFFHICQLLVSYNLSVSPDNLDEIVYPRQAQLAEAPRDRVEQHIVGVLFDDDHPAVVDLLQPPVPFDETPPEPGH